MSSYKIREDYFSRKITELREARDYTQAFVAKHLGITRSAYSYYELGKTRPSMFTLKKLSTLYDVSIAIFYNEPN